APDGGPALAASLFRESPGRTPPLVVMLSQDDPAARARALAAGADDVIARPFDKALLLARLRALLRRQHARDDYPLSSDTAQVLGFADAQAGFRQKGRIALIAPPGAAARQAGQRLADSGGFCVTTVAADAAITLAGGPSPPDIYVLAIGGTDSDAALRLMADLRAAPRTRHHPVVALLSASSAHGAAALLDMGASEALLPGMSGAEIRLRLDRQLEHKTTLDTLRRQMHSGLDAALRDPLTGIHNRRYALPHLRRLLDRGGPAGRGIAVMVADLDHFKAVNDRHGHAAGDAVLRQVAGRLCGLTGDAGLVARIGGEEFLIVMPGLTRRQARRLADRACAAVRDTPIALGDGKGPVRVTVSLGVTMAHPGLTPPGGVDTLIGKADSALYEAKARGRDTVTFCTRSAA
ncbi:diguanylate cyclase domain-containing protein, partial [Roseovarius sp. SYSU LYC5161]|uniref:diguanylate cyclase domain-containing protein n=1 Tax=Roseovarius halophilus (ex Wu et al. 2025) TaxID=3376060 RepID=UPI0039999201